MISETLAHTRVYRGGQCWIVSTINRPSSAYESCGSVYAETMAFTTDRQIVAQDEGPDGCVKKHLYWVQRISEMGEAAFAAAGGEEEEQ